MSKVIAIASQKGGVGKSTTCRNLATELSKAGYKVLAVDCDNQASMTDCFGIDKPELLDKTLYHLMMNVINDEDLPAKETYILTKENVDVITSSIELSAIEINLVSTISREYVLKTIIDDLRDDYDYILLDCMPSLGLFVHGLVDYRDNIEIETAINALYHNGELRYSKLFMLKRTAFKHEEEYRLFVFNPVERSGNIVQIDYSHIEDFIVSVMLYPRAPDWFDKTLEEYCSRNSLNYVGKSKMYKELFC